MGTGATSRVNVFLGTFKQTPKCGRTLKIHRTKQSPSPHPSSLIRQHPKVSLCYSARFGQAQGWSQLMLSLVQGYPGSQGWCDGQVSKSCLQTHALNQREPLRGSTNSPCCRSSHTSGQGQVITGLFPGPLIGLVLSWGLQETPVSGDQQKQNKNFHVLKSEWGMGNVKAELSSVGFHDTWFALEINTRVYS